jgi:hypothetical protein
MRSIPLPPQDYLRTLITYDKRTGIVRWKHNKKIVGKPDKRGYMRIMIDRRLYLLHRVIFKLVTGKEPPEIDHRGCDPSDNRWVTIRAATRTKNGRNIRTHTDNRTGFKGVNQYVAKSGKGFKTYYQARICVNKKQMNIGNFKTAKEAHAAYCAAADLHFGKFARHG